MENFNEANINKNLRHAENSPTPWGKWSGIPERALAHLTDDIYAYEIENSAYGNGIAIKYGDKNFWYSIGNKALFNSTNTRITAKEMRAVGNNVMAEQINRLIEQALLNLEKNDKVS